MGGANLSDYLQTPTQNLKLWCVSEYLMTLDMVQNSNSYRSAVSLQINIKMYILQSLFRNYTPSESLSDNFSS